MYAYEVKVIANVHTDIIQYEHNYNYVKLNTE